MVVISVAKGLVRLGELGKLKKLINLIVPRTRDLPACNVVLQPLRHRVPYPILLRRLNWGEYGLREMLHAWER
jgi:hypothetical protein